MHAHTHPRDHTHSDGGESRRLAFAIVLTLAVAALEAIGGLLANSVVLLADAGHMITDALALTLAWFAVRLSRKPANAEYSYGHSRFAALAAFVNGLGILGIGFGLAWESIEHVRNPVLVDARLMLGVAIIGGACNLVVLKMLGHGAHEHGSLNMRAAAIHVASDLLGSAAAVVAAVAILTTGWMLADPVASLLVTVLIWRSGLRIVRDSARVLLEAAPKGFDSAMLERDLLTNVADIAGIHHLHVWTLSGSTPILSLHAVAKPGVDADAALKKIHERLKSKFGIDHATVQIEQSACDDDCSAAKTPKMI